MVLQNLYRPVRLSVNEKIADSYYDDQVAKSAEERLDIPV